MNWFLIVEVAGLGLKALGPFRDESEAADVISLIQERMDYTGYFDTFPSMETNPDIALKEWLREKGG